ncbi:MAG: leucine-rich repeat domain-containing protein, partial [Ruminococcus sp.]|nr:leucine-rich repeat domain-containing protein [Ruminococcus sp.]
RGTGATYDYEIGKSPFFENENITSLIVSEGVTAIGKSIFERCYNMATASLPTTLESIGERAFFMYKDGGLTALNFPESVTKIGERAFLNQNLDSVVLPETLTDLGTYIFNGSNLKSVRVECAEIPSFCFSSCLKLSQMTISRNVRKIGAYMITYCKRLQEIVYEGSLADWSAVQKMKGWDGHDTSALERIRCENGYFEYDSENDEWSEMSA